MTEGCVYSLSLWIRLLQIHNRYEGKDISKHKRNLVIAGGVTLSVIVSPVVAAVTVGKQTSFFFLSNDSLYDLNCSLFYEIISLFWTHKPILNVGN